MIRTIIVGTDSKDGESLESILQRSGRFVPVRTLREFKQGYELERELRVHVPDTVFVSVNSEASLAGVHGVVKTTVPGTPVVAFGEGCDPQRLLDLMKVGVRQFLSVPPDPNDLLQLAAAIEEHLTKNPHPGGSLCPLFTFLPAKLGVGASTLASHVGVAISRDSKARCLILDCDLNSGLIAFMLKAGANYSLLEATEVAHEIDADMWGQMVTRVGALDVLPSGKLSPGARIDETSVRQLVSFLRTQYQVILADLSGNLEKYSIELMRESSFVFVVTTPEIPSLYLSRDRLELLRSNDLGERVRLVVNREHSTGPIPVQRIEQTLSAPVFASFPDDYRSIHQALLTGKPLSARTRFGNRCSRFARMLIEPEGLLSTKPSRSQVAMTR